MIEKLIIRKFGLKNYMKFTKLIIRDEKKKNFFWGWTYKVCRWFET